ncbi:MAG: sigma-70 family RNA polymerase sigma factor [bacterium]|nr:sigma-70 family RNA polymerase sigma factor [bacterium]
MTLLIEKYHPLVSKLSFKFAKSSNLFQQEDFYQEGLMALLEAEKNFNISKNVKFLTYVYTCVNNAMLSLIRNNVLKNLAKNESDICKSDFGLENQFFYDNCESFIDCSEILESLESEEKDLLTKRFIESYTLEAIAKELNLSIEAISRRIDRILDKLRRKYEKNFIS